MTHSDFPKPERWQSALIDAITDPQELLERLALDPALLEHAQAAAQLFPLKVTKSFVDRMKKGDPNDPLLRQVLPIGLELQQTSGYYSDPLQESAVNPIPGLLHKYDGRVLLIMAGSCGINCRFCFRRHFPYTDNNPGTQGWEKAIDYIRQNNTITEVILSGGEPLIVNDATLAQLVSKLSAIPHLKRLRIHTRMPIILPERLTPRLIEWMTTTRLSVALTLHCNHPQEINQTVKDALQPLIKPGITLLNQSVLLKGINDTVETLKALSETLYDCGVLPYYLHVNDKVQGTAHFDLPLETAQALHWSLSQVLPGYLVPKLVAEYPGKGAKTLVNLALSDQ